MEFTTVDKTSAPRTLKITANIRQTISARSRDGRPGYNIYRNNIKNYSKFSASLLATKNRIILERKVISGSIVGSEKTLFFTQNEIIVGFYSRSAIERARFALSYGLVLIWFDYIGNFGLYKSTSVGGISMFFEKFRTDDRVLFSEPNVIDGIEDEYDDAEEGLEKVEFPRTPWNLIQIEHEKYSNARDGYGVLICVVDGKFDINNAAISGRVFPYCRETDFTDRGEATSLHGLQVASVIGNQARYGSGLSASLAPNAQILPIAINTVGVDSYPARARAINFLAEVCNQKAFYHSSLKERIAAERTIVCCSWKVRSIVDLTSVREAFSRLAVSGALVVCSAGNEDDNGEHFPSDYRGCVSVGGITSSMQKYPGSNYGARVDLGAPAGDGKPFDESDIVVADHPTGYTYNFGTSFAAPHVAGVAAAFWSRRRDANASQVRNSLLETCVMAYPSTSTAFGKLGRGSLTMRGLQSANNLTL